MTKRIDRSSTLGNTIDHDNTRHFVWLDLLRGIAALLVCAGHLRAFLFVYFKSINDFGVIELLFYFLTGLGHQAVVIFFVLSGFFVGGSVFSAFANGTWPWSRYSIQRLVRLWLVLVPALLLTLLWDIGGIHFSRIWAMTDPCGKS